jgi:hypothetical protein
MEMSIDGKFFECENVLARYSNVQITDKLSFKTTYCGGMKCYYQK